MVQTWLQQTTFKRANHMWHTIIHVNKDNFDVYQEKDCYKQQNHNLTSFYFYFIFIFIHWWHHFFWKYFISNVERTRFLLKFSNPHEPYFYPHTIYFFSFQFLLDQIFLYIVSFKRFYFRLWFTSFTPLLYYYLITKNINYKTLSIKNYTHDNHS